MTKYEIMAMMMHNENQFDGAPAMVAAKLAFCLEALSDRLRDEELAQLIQVGGAIYHCGVEESMHTVAPEDLFPACENWPTPNPVRGEDFLHRKP